MAARIQSALESVQCQNSSAEILKTLLRQGRMFADCAVQVHYGDEISPKQVINNGRLGWHNDAANSLLHGHLDSWAQGPPCQVDAKTSRGMRTGG